MRYFKLTLHHDSRPCPWEPVPCFISFSTQNYLMSNPGWSRPQRLQSGCCSAVRGLLTAASSNQGMDVWRGETERRKSRTRKWEGMQGLQLVLTTHRLVWIDVRAMPSAGVTCALHLACVRAAHLKATHVWSTPKVRINVNIDGNGRPVGENHLWQLADAAVHDLEGGVCVQTMCGGMKGLLTLARRLHQSGKRTSGNEEHSDTRPLSGVLHCRGLHTPELVITCVGQVSGFHCLTNTLLDYKHPSSRCPVGVWQKQGFGVRTALVLDVSGARTFEWVSTNIWRWGPQAGRKQQRG